MPFSSATALHQMDVPAAPDGPDGPDAPDGCTRGPQGNNICLHSGNTYA